VIQNNDLEHQFSGEGVERAHNDDIDGDQDDVKHEKVIVEKGGFVKMGQDIGGKEI